MFGSINLAHTNGSIFHWQITVNELAKIYHLELQKEEIDYMIVKDTKQKTRNQQEVFGKHGWTVLHEAKHRDF